MLRKRIIFTLIYADGFFMQSRNFRLQKVGNIDWIEKNYNLEEVAFSLDELVILNASRSNKDVLSFSNVLRKITEDVFIPISAGGGIRSLEDARTLFESGADKIVLNTSLYDDPNLVKSLIEKYGSQSIIASIDYKKDKVFIDNNSREINTGLYDYLEYVKRLGVGEIYLNSIEKDGTGFGYDIETIKSISKTNSVPLIIAGGAGNVNHLMDGLLIDGVNATATANLFNFVGDSFYIARKKIIDKGKSNIVSWDREVAASLRNSCN
jgi:cyclase